MRCTPLKPCFSLWILLAISGCSSTRHLSFLVPQGPIAAAERLHFFWVVGILVVFVAGPIFLFLPWVLWRYRLRARKSAYRPGWKANVPLEIMTWAGPIVIVIVLSAMLWRYAHELDPYAPVHSNKQDTVHVQAIGYDWKWLFVYPDKGIATAGILVIPVNRPIAMHLTSATVMQSLHIPALASQIYAMGGMNTQLHFMATKAGRSLGENNMYNGSGFHKQRFTTIAMPSTQFKAWVKKVQATGKPLTSGRYKTLAKRATMAELVRDLPEASHDGHVYLTQVSPDLYPAVIDQTKTEKRDALDQALQKADKVSKAATAGSTTSVQEDSP